MRQAEEALRKSSVSYADIVRASTDLICRFTPTGQLLFINRACYFFFGQQKETLLALNFYDLFPDIPHLIKSLSPCAQQITVETCYTFSETVSRWIQWTILALFENGQIAFYQGVGRDITEYKEEVKNILLQFEQHRQQFSLDRYKFGEIIGRSPAMQQVYEMIEKASLTNSNVLIVGESGTGKELVAQTIRKMSTRKEQAFVAVNCGAVPENLFEREFFGHRKGAFTGADSDQPGYFDRAHGGTLFLDEISEMSSFLQVKLLRALQEREYIPLGDIVSKKVNVRIIAATNKDLEHLMQQGLIREDFFYRICVITIHLPPLRDRREDIPLLVEYFLAKQQKTLSDLSIQQLDRLYHQHYPGNIRELQNTVERMIAGIQSDTERFRAEQIHQQKELRSAIDEFEQKCIFEVLLQHHGHKQKSAEFLGIDIKTLYRKLKKYNL